MVEINEQVHSARVRVFKWNEKLSKSIISKNQGLFLFCLNETVISTTQGASGGTDNIDVSQESHKAVDVFELSDLLSLESLESLIQSAVSKPYLFREATTALLSQQIFTYLAREFHFSSALLQQNSPWIVIVLNVHRTLSYTQEEFDEEEEEEVVEDIELYDEGVFMDEEEGNREDDYEGSYSETTDDDSSGLMNDPDDDHREILAYLREVNGVIEVPRPMRPIALDEPLGLLRVVPENMVEKVLISDHDGEIDTCAICLDELAKGSEVAKTPCLHLFHRDCIFKWLPRVYSCPMCRSVLPRNEVIFM